MMHSMPGAAFWSITVVVLWFLLVGGAAWATVWVIRHPHRQPPPALPSPLDILERRFAAGDLTREDFDEARARLREHELDL
ncbi:MAG: SHOCT domain-containing protein [Kribbellaceae bacterium]|nr:SHOCT domain-containing protein [Kribbellaceae bacterium]